MSSLFMRIRMKCIQESPVFRTLIQETGDFRLKQLYGAYFRCVDL